jgi:hypothetical protein
VDAETEVFLGDVKKVGDKEEVVWKSTKNTNHKLNRKTLEPNKEFYRDPNRITPKKSIKAVFENLEDEEEDRNATIYDNN